jgi:hypothetical protein
LLIAMLIFSFISCRHWLMPLAIISWYFAILLPLILWWLPHFHADFAISLAYCYAFDIFDAAAAIDMPCWLCH